MSEMLKQPQYVIEGIILRRLHEKRIEGYTIETAKEIAEAVAALQSSAVSEPMRSMTATEEDAVRRALLASGTPLYDLPQTAPSDIERAFQDACDEAGCAYGNEALLEAIHALKERCQAVCAEPSEAQIDAAAEVIWNDRDARMGGPWKGRGADEVCIIQTRATARAALVAALRARQRDPAEIAK
jgi:predicted lipoprotein